VTAADATDYEAASSITNLNATIYPAGNNIIMAYPGIAEYQLYEMMVWNDPVDIRNGDKFVSGSDSWIVQGIPKVYDDGILYCLYMILVKVVGT